MIIAFRTLEISNEAEIHIKDGQLEVTNKNVVVLIPLEDLSVIMLHGANIRLSTMDVSILSQNKISLSRKLVIKQGFYLLLGLKELIT